MPYRRLLAWLKDEVPADDLEAFRAAGGIVAALLLDRERLLQQLELDGDSVWTAAPAARGPAGEHLVRGRPADPG